MNSHPLRRQAMRSLLYTGLAMAAARCWGAPPGTAAETARGAPKFHGDGTVAHWPGNTILCHVDRRSEAFMALLDMHAALMRSGLTHRLAVLPPASYHMTVFEGVAYAMRHQYYPADLPPDAGPAQCDALLAERLRGFDLGCETPFRMRPLPLAEQSSQSAILLEPVDAAENRKLRGLRDRLAEALKMKAANHERYRFHITLNYMVGRMDAAEDVRFAALRRALLEGFIARSPLVELGRPEYTLFDDMFAFRRQLYLENRGAASS